MANKKSNNSENDIKSGCFALAVLIGLSVLILLFTILSMLFQLIPIVVPTVFLIMSLVNWYIYRHKDWLHISNGFWLQEHEKNDFIYVANIIHKAEINRNNVHNAVQNEGIHINQNGRISMKSYRGKELRNTLENANATIDEYLPVYERLRNLPKNRWKTAKKHFVKYKGAAWACIIWISFLIISVGNPISGFKQYISKIGKTGESGIEMVTDMWSSILNSSTDSIAASSQEQSINTDKATETVCVENNFQIEFGKILWKDLFLSLIVYVILTVITTIIFRIKYKCPPQVNTSNVLAYDVHYNSKPKKKTIQKEKKIQETYLKINKTKPESHPITEKLSNSPTETYESKEHEIFQSWAKRLKAEGYIPIGNWENWAKTNQWKNLSVKLSLKDIKVRATIEYDTKSKKIYCGIQKADEQDVISQPLLKSSLFKNIMNKMNMSLKNNEWWYCSKFVSFSDAYEQLQELMNVIVESK